MARQTIRLVPKKSDAASAVSVAAPAKPKPSDPTINLQDRVAVEETAQTLPRPSDPTTKLTPTQMMHAPAPEATAKAISTPEHRAEVHQAQPAPAIVPPPSAVAAQPVEEPHKKIGIKLHTGSHAAAEATPHPELAKPGHSHTASAVSVADEEPVVEQEVAKAKDEPSILFTIAAAVALLTIGFLSFVLFVQFDNHWWGGNMKVPGLVSLVK